MDYSITDKFTLVPQQMDSPEFIKELFGTCTNENIAHVAIEQYGAVLYFIKDNTESLPIICFLLKEIGEIKEHNKIAVSFCKEKQIVFITAAEGEKLRLANSYKAADFTTALYFIMLATQQMMFNPLLTELHFYNAMEPQDIELVNRYFKDCKLHNL